MLLLLIFLRQVRPALTPKPAPTWAYSTKCPRQGRGGDPVEFPSFLTHSAGVSPCSGKRLRARVCLKLGQDNPRAVQQAARPRVAGKSGLMVRAWCCSSWTPSAGLLRPLHSTPTRGEWVRNPSQRVGVRSVSTRVNDSVRTKPKSQLAWKLCLRPHSKQICRTIILYLEIDLSFRNHF